VSRLIPHVTVDLPSHFMSWTGLLYELYGHKSAHVWLLLWRYFSWIFFSLLHALSRPSKTPPELAKIWCVCPVLSPFQVFFALIGYLPKIGANNNQIRSLKSNVETPGLLDMLKKLYIAVHKDLYMEWSLGKNSNLDAVPIWRWICGLENGFERKLKSLMASRWRRWWR
jgi:hypothetical protein